MSEQLTAVELREYQRRCVARYGDTISRRGRALQFDEHRFVIDCLSCRGSGARRPGSPRTADSFVCPRCGGSGIEIVGEKAARNVCGRDRVDYLPEEKRNR